MLRLKGSAKNQPGAGPGLRESGEVLFLGDAGDDGDGGEVGAGQLQGEDGQGGPVFRLNAAADHALAGAADEVPGTQPVL